MAAPNNIQKARVCKTPEERFFDKVTPEPNSGCWLWTACVNEKGYGTFRDDKKVKAHRFSYELHVGPIPDGLQIDHLCRVRSCVNPDHLEAVTCAENLRRGDGGFNNATKTHCPSGHSYSGDNLYVRPNGNRECRACRLEANRRHRRSLISEQ